METKGVSLARRKTGGGAVYHDLHNTCFSFFNPLMPGTTLPLDTKQVNNYILIDALQQSFNITAEVSGRNDITINNKKVSGSAYQVSLSPQPKLLHHGTMLVDIDIL